jgi:hypothetical protein
MFGPIQPLEYHFRGNPVSTTEHPLQQWRAAIYNARLIATKGKRLMPKQIAVVYL